MRLYGVARPTLLAAALAATLAACHTKPPPPAPNAPPERAHHRDGAFQNRYTEFETRPARDFWQWKLDQWRNGLPPPPTTPIPTAAPDRAFIATNARAGRAMQPAATWIGHATVLVQMGGVNVITDPIFSERASPVDFTGPRRLQPPALALAELPRIDVVLVSHNHYDHCDIASLRTLARQEGGSPLFVVPLGVRVLLAENGIERVAELDWWESVRVDGASGPVEIVLTPVQHWSGRRLDDRMRTLWGGYAVFAPDLHLYFAGDTGYSRDFADTRARFASRQSPERGGGFDLALLPIGAYEPRWFMQTSHVNPDEAVRAHLDLGAKRSLGVHWGTFPLTDEPLDQPPRDLDAARVAHRVQGDVFVTMPIGGTLKLAPR
jgi:N-acyl-phosphatidylethanolamine-hydrolysing phospholipase D